MNTITPNFTQSRKSTINTALIAIGIAFSVNIGLMVLIHHLNTTGINTKKMYELEEINLSKIMPKPLKMPEPEKPKPPKKKRIKPKVVKKRIVKAKNRPLNKVQAKPIDLKIDMKLAPMPGLSFTNVSPPEPIAEDQDEYQVFSLEAVDQPPQPLFRTPPIYPPSAKRLGLEGWVLIEFVVDEKGIVTDVNVRDSSSRRFNQSACACVKSWRFKPGIKEKREVPVLCTQKLTFELSN